MINLKQHLYNLCLAYTDQRIKNAENAMKLAQEAVHNDTKSSAGDKYETGRAMAQQEIDTNRKQLMEAQKLKLILHQIQPDKMTGSVQTGSVVITNKGNFYIAISAGQLAVEGNMYFAISAVSPIGAKLMRQKAGAVFNFNGKDFSITEVL